MAGSDSNESGTPQYDVITTAQDLKSQKKLLLMRSSNVHQPYKHGHYHQHRQALKLSLSRASMPIWTIFFRGKTVLWSQKMIETLILG